MQIFPKIHNYIQTEQFLRVKVKKGFNVSVEKKGETIPARSIPPRASNTRSPAIAICIH